MNRKIKKRKKKGKKKNQIFKKKMPENKTMFYIFIFCVFIACIFIYMKMKKTTKIQNLETPPQQTRQPSSVRRFHMV